MEQTKLLSVIFGCWGQGTISRVPGREEWGNIYGEGSIHGIL